MFLKFSPNFNLNSHSFSQGVSISHTCETQCEMDKGFHMTFHIVHTCETACEIDIRYSHVFSHGLKFHIFFFTAFFTG